MIPLISKLGISIFIILMIAAFLYIAVRIEKYVLFGILGIMCLIGLYMVWAIANYIYEEFWG